MASNKPLLDPKDKEEAPIFIPDEAGEGGPEDKNAKPFVYNAVGLSSAEAARLLAVHGPNSLPEKKVPKWKIFVNLLIAPMPLMIFFAAFIEWSIGNLPDMGILLFINFANAGIGFYETVKAGDLCGNCREVFVFHGLAIFVATSANFVATSSSFVKLCQCLPNSPNLVKLRQRTNAYDTTSPD